MKKFLLAVLIALTPLIFFSCGDDSDSKEVETEEKVSFEKLEGVVRKLGASIYPEGTHRLEANGTLVALLEAASVQIDLDDFIGKSVEIEGILSPTVDGNLEILKVVAITPRTTNEDDEGIGEITVEKATYEDIQFGFSIEYSTALEVKQTRRGVAFFSNENKVIELIVLENSAKQTLLDWLIDNYGYTSDALSRISVAGLTGFQFQNTTGSVIYLDNDDQVFTLAWFDIDSENRAGNRLHYLEIIQSFSLDSSPVSLSEDEPAVAFEGDFCGGIAAIQCASGFECRLSGSYPDSGGICVIKKTSVVVRPKAATSDQVLANEDLDKISAAELQRGWYYGDREEKKPGTPVTWILVNSGTRAAMWRCPEDTPAEPTFELSEANTTSSELSDEQNIVLNFLEKNINSFVPEAAENGKWSLAQLAFVEPNFVYSIYESLNSKGEMQMRRLLFIYEISDNDEVSLEMQSYFKPGDEKDWLVIEGADTAFGEAQKIVDSSGDLISNVSAGQRLFSDYSNKISFQYPKNWYWRKSAAGKIEFADRPFPAGVVILTAKILAGDRFDFDSMYAEGDETVIYLRYNSEKSVRLSIKNSNYLDVLEMAANSFELLD